jgi:hypothetical protein
MRMFQVSSARCNNGHARANASNRRVDAGSDAVANIHAHGDSRTSADNDSGAHANTDADP